MLNFKHRSLINENIVHRGKYGVLMCHSYRYSLFRTVGIIVIIFTLYSTFDQIWLSNQKSDKTKTINYDEDVRKKDDLTNVKRIDLSKDPKINKKEIPLEDEEMVSIPLKDIMARPFTFSVDHKRLLEIIVNDYSRKPSKNPYMLDDPSLDTSNWQQREILKLLKNKKNGVFVECGALHGEYLSNTLELEMKHNWTGVLIEPDPISYKRLLKKNRKAWTVEACLSSKNYMKQVILKQGDALSKIIDDNIKKQDKNKFVNVQCFPLISILLALNITKIDYFSLDIEGEELNVLKKIPWDKVNITTFSIEFNHVPEGKQGLKNFMKEKGYKVYVDGSQLAIQSKQNVDLIFYHEKLLGYVP